MSNFYKILMAVVAVAISITLLTALPTSTGTLTSRTLTFSKSKGTTLVPANMMYLQGDSIYISSIEINGTWKAKPWPYEAMAWLKDKTSDNPLASLDWTGIDLDSTWACSDMGSGVGKYTINKKYTQEYNTGKWSNPALTGFLAQNSAYTVDVYTVAGGNATLAKTVKFDKANNDTNFSRVLYEVSYVAEGRGSYPINEAKRPDSLVTATVQSRIYLRNGLSNAWFNIPDGTDSIKYVFKSKDGEFASISQAVQVLSFEEVGFNPEVKIVTPLPTEGYYNPGDTLEIAIDIKDNAGNIIDWVNNGANLGTPRIEVLLSGPKDDYAQIFTNRYIYNNGFQYDSVSKAKYNSNKVKMVIPDVLPNGAGTYTIFVGGRRTLGANYQKVSLTDVQIGSNVVKNINFTSQDVNQSCSKCHGFDGPALHHSASGVEECLPCHTKTFRTGVGFDEIVHNAHRMIVDHEENLPVENCNQCHLNGSENKFGKEAETACKACHPVIPYMPLDHFENVPLYSATGKSCASSNCHAGGNIGVFKNIPETHAALKTKYVGGNVAAKKSSSDIPLDAFDIPQWNQTGSVTTLDGIELKFFYTNTDIIIRAEWTDGHSGYDGPSAGSLSVARNQWSFDGTSWKKSGNEDRLAFLWQMDSPLGASCALSCHGTSYFNATAGHSTGMTSLSSNPTGKIDNWHWKAQRTMPVDFVDDGYWDNAGRKSDATTAGYFGKDNQTTDGKLPAKMAKDASNNSKPYIMESETTDFVADGFKAGDKLFGYYVNDGTQPIITGSRSDVRAKARFNETTKKWTVIFKRALNTTNTDDAVFDINKTIEFTVAKMDNEGSKHAAQGVDIGVYKLSFSTDVVSVEKQIEAVNDIKVYPNPIQSESNISFTIEKTNFVNLVLIDAKGNVVSTLVNKVMNPGSYNIPLNNMYLSSGMYYMQLYAGEKKYMKPVAIIK